jgi:uncharacterized membrane protein
MKKKSIIFISISILLISAIPFYLYFSTFNGEKSLLNADWGNFGDFIGGILSPILALFNLIAFLYLTYVIHDFDKNSKNKELNYQKKLIYSNEKYNLFKKINHSVNKVRFILLSNTEKKYEAVTELFENCDSAFIDIKILFPEVGISDNDIKTTQDKFLALLKEIKYAEDNKMANSNAFNFSKDVIDHTNTLLKKVKNSIDNDLNINNQ